MSKYSILKYALLLFSFVNVYCWCTDNEAMAGKRSETVAVLPSRPTPSNVSPLKYSPPSGNEKRIKVAQVPASTVNPAVPVPGAALLSEPIRNNFQAAQNDINAIYNLFTGVVYVNVANLFTAPQTFTNSDLLLLGSSTGYTTFTSANASAINYNFTVPAASGTAAVSVTAPLALNATTGAVTWNIAQALPTGLTAATNGSAADTSAQIATDAFVHNALTAGFPDGTVSAPGITFAADLSTGLYRIGTDDIALATNGTKALEINSSQAVSIPSGLTVSSSFTATGLVTNSDLANEAAYSKKCNLTGSVAAPTDCADISNIIIGPCDGSTDLTSKINAALLGLSGTGGAITFQAGKCVINSTITYSYPSTQKFSVTFAGAGMNATYLYWPSVDGMVLTAAYASQTVHFRDLGIITGTTAKTGIKLIQTVYESDVEQSDFTNVYFAGADEPTTNADYWAYGIYIQNWSDFNIVGASMYGAYNSGTPLGVGVYAVSTGSGTSQLAFFYNIDKSIFIYNNTGILIGSQIQGVTVNAAQFVNGIAGIVVAGSGTNNSLIVVTNSEFNQLQNQIGFNSTVASLFATNNVFYETPGYSGIITAAGQQHHIANNVFTCLACTGGTNVTVGVNFTGSTILSTVSNNEFYNMEYGVVIPGGSSNNIVSANIFQTNIIYPVLNYGSNSIVSDNIGYNPVGAAGITTSSSPFTYTAGSSPETTYWAATTITNVTQGGTSILPAALGTTDLTVQLGPNEAVVISYTGTLVGKKMVH